MLRLAFDFIITWRETRTRPNAYFENNALGQGNRSLVLGCKERCFVFRV